MSVDNALQTTTTFSDILEVVTGYLESAARNLGHKEQLEVLSVPRASSTPTDTTSSTTNATVFAKNT